MLEPEQPTPSGLRRHRFMGRSIDLPEDLTEAQLDCVHPLRCRGSADAAGGGLE
jgi:hypothetical protein